MFNAKNILLYPLSLVYGLITETRNFLYNNGVLHSVVFNLPVICIGNITIGGTGKTPHTEYLANLLRKNYMVATLSRGYKRKSRDFRIAQSSSSVLDIGDEPIQLLRKFPDILVTVDRDRVNGIKRILETRPETDVVIMDDGFQHRRLTPGFSILLSDYERLIMRDFILPYGSLRESKDNMSRADVILITKSPSDLSPIQRRLIVKEVNKLPFQKLFFTSFSYGEPVPVFENTSRDCRIDTPFPQDSSILLITGIANPKPLIRYLEKKYKEIIHLEFPDHYNFKEKDGLSVSSAFNELKSPSKFLFTTEKDAVRLREFTNIGEPLRSLSFFIPVSILFLNEDQQKFDNLIIDYVRKNKKNHRVS